MGYPHTRAGRGISGNYSEVSPALPVFSVEKAGLWSLAIRKGSDVAESNLDERIPQFDLVPDHHALDYPYFALLATAGGMQGIMLGRAGHGRRRGGLDVLIGVHRQRRHCCDD